MGCRPHGANGVWVQAGLGLGLLCLRCLNVGSPTLHSATLGPCRQCWAPWPMALCTQGVMQGVGTVWHAKEQE